MAAPWSVERAPTPDAPHAPDRNDRWSKAHRSTDVNSLSLLSTGSDITRAPLVPFQATSAASAQGARLAARLVADHPEYWPETIRGLIVHSAEWTKPMIAAFDGTDGKKEITGLHEGLVTACQTTTARSRQPTII